MSTMYAIIRTQKHKSIESVARSARHNFREQPTPNADEGATTKNRFAGSRGTKDLIRSLTDRLPITRRRDAVLCIEYLITASPEAFTRHGGHLDERGSGYFSDALKWLQDRHGRDNLISAAIHLDETTPHLVAYVVPLTRDGRLSARDFLGGPKILRALQDSFHQTCGQSHGLLRGVPGSKARHTEIQQFYTALHDPGLTVKLTAQDYAAKALGHETEAWKQAQALAKQQAQQAAKNSLQRKALSARTRALEEAEQRVEQSARQAHELVNALEKREQTLVQREMELVKRQPEIDIAVARAESAERLLQLYEQRSSTAPVLSRKKIYSPSPVSCP